MTVTVATVACEGAVKSITQRPEYRAYAAAIARLKAASPRRWLSPCGDDEDDPDTYARKDREWDVAQSAMKEAAAEVDAVRPAAQAQINAAAYCREAEAILLAAETLFYAQPNSKMFDLKPTDCMNIAIAASNRVEGLDVNVIGPAEIYGRVSVDGTVTTHTP